MSNFYFRGEDVYGIDFKGGQVIEYKLTPAPHIETVRSKIKEGGLTGLVIQKFKDIKEITGLSSVDDIARVPLKKKNVKNLILNEIKTLKARQQELNKLKLRKFEAEKKFYRFNYQNLILSIFKSPNFQINIRKLEEKGTIFQVLELKCEINKLYQNFLEVINKTITNCQIKTLRNLFAFSIYRQKL